MLEAIILLFQGIVGLFCVAWDMIDWLREKSTPVNEKLEYEHFKTSSRAKKVVTHPPAPPASDDRSALEALLSAQGVLLNDAEKAELRKKFG